MGGVVSASQPVALPTTAAQAALALRMLSSDYFAASGNTTEQAAVHAEAQKIRAEFPSSGPAGGYTQAQLAQASTWVPAYSSPTSSGASAVPATSSSRTISGQQGYYTQSTYVAGRGWVYSGWHSTATVTAAQYAATSQQAAQAAASHSTAVSASLPVAMPSTAAQAATALRMLSSDYFAAAGNASEQAALHAEAQTIRTEFPGAGPSGGYALAQLKASTTSTKKTGIGGTLASVGAVLGSVATGAAENLLRLGGTGGVSSLADTLAPYATAAAVPAAAATGFAVAGVGGALAINKYHQQIANAGAAVSTAVSRALGTSGTSTVVHTSQGNLVWNQTRSTGIAPTVARTTGSISVSRQAAQNAGSAATTAAATAEGGGSGGAAIAVSAPTTAAATASGQRKRRTASGTGGSGGTGSGAGSGFLSGAGRALGTAVGTGAAIGGGAALIGGTPQGQAAISAVGQDVGKAIGAAAHGVAAGTKTWPWWLWALIAAGVVVGGHEAGVF